MQNVIGFLYTLEMLMYGDNKNQESKEKIWNLFKIWQIQEFQFT